MTDTIDVAALVERVVRDFSNACTDWDGSQMADGEEPRFIPNCGYMREIATALQSQAGALAEARRKLTEAHELTEAVQCEAMTATASLATMREALERAELAARNLMPYLEWQLSAESPGHHPTFGSAVAYFKGSFAPWVFAPGSSRFDDWHTRRALGGSNAE